MTTGIVIAAGLGSRMGALTADRPKCMLPVAGAPILHNTMRLLHRAGCDRIVVVTGYLHDRIVAPGAELVHNADYRSNNILHSLMHARHALLGDVICSYSDIWVEDRVFDTLVARSGDLVIAVDEDWRPYYEGRQHHPLSEAEKVHYDGMGHVREIGKLVGEAGANESVGEFLGLWRMSAAGTRSFVAAFDRVAAATGPTAPFMRAKEWRKAYITDHLQFMVDAGDVVSCALVQRGWAELDTEEDYRRLPAIAARQGLQGVLRPADNSQGSAERMLR